MSKPRVLVVVPVFNLRDKTLRCIGSLFAMDYPNFNVMVVDCGSTEDVRESIAEQFPRVKIFETTDDIWWPGGINIGIRYAEKQGHEYVLMMNQDHVVDENMLSKLVQRIESVKLAIVGPKVYYLQSPQRIFSAGGIAEWWGRGMRNRGIGRIDTGRFNECTDVDWLGGAGTLVRRDTFSKIGMMDAEKFRWGSDFDFSYRAKCSGMRVLIESDAVMWHDAGDITPHGRQKPLTLREMFSNFFNERTPFHLKRQWTIYRVHCPRPWMPIFFPSRVFVMTLIALRSYFISKRLY